MLENCCEKYNLGEYASNEDKIFDLLIAPDTGYYFFELKYLGVVKKIRLQFNAGDILMIPSSQYISEDQTFQLSIKGPDGSYVSFAYTTCFIFSTVINLVKCEPCNELPYGITHPYSFDNDSSVDIGTM